MRIACVHVPYFALQCLTRVDPSLSAEVPAAVVGGGTPGAPGASVALHGPIVLGATKSARALGIRLGMTATVARSLVPELRIETADASLERETVRALADALLGISPTVDVGGRLGPAGAHLALYCEVPAKMRGSTFGDRLLSLVASLGVWARIGIADDRFTAWVAAAYAAPESQTGVTSVPRGGSASFLSPRPLSLLAISAEVQHMLELLGVRTLGEFAALPSPSVARPFEADYQALARGEGSSLLRSYAPDAPIREEHALLAGAPAEGTGTLFGGAEAVAVVAERIALRLAGRARGAARLDVSIAGAAPIASVSVSLAPIHDARVLSDAASLAEAIGGAVGEVAATRRSSLARLSVVVTGEAVAADGAAQIAESVADAADAALIAAAATAAEESARANALTLVLSRSVLDRWQLDPPAAVASGPELLRAERRDAHRRTRRSRPRRAEVAQPVLFAAMTAAGGAERR
ncbi:MAG TPA: hypothetical protein VGM88_01915 [Kofleriaceae bacterium]|jgi:nucleotidyltransferase/DNA polymerase involved in DNA repair